MRTHRFGKKIKLPATSAIKHQIRVLMLEDAQRALAAEVKPVQPRSSVHRVTDEARVASAEIL